MIESLCGGADALTKVVGQVRGMPDEAALELGAPLIRSQGIQFSGSQQLGLGHHQAGIVLTASDTVRGSRIVP